MSSRKRWPAVLLVLPVAALLSSCILRVGEDPWEGTDASVTFDWTVNGLAAGSGTCSDVDGNQVRMSISTTSTERNWYPQFQWSCSAGSASTATVFALGTYHIVLQLRDISGTVLSEVSITPTPTLYMGSNNLGTINFEVDGPPPDYASVTFDWLINGSEPSDCECTNGGGGDQVRLSVSDTSGATDWLTTSWSCGAGEASTDAIFDPGTYYLVAELLDVDGGSLSITDEWEQTLSAGSNDVGTMDFATGTSSDQSFTWTWTVEGHPYEATLYESLCAWAGWGSSTIRLMIDVDEDTYEDFYYDADCIYGGATTDPALDPGCYVVGDTVWFAFQLIASDDSVVAQSETYTTLTVAAGENDLGNVDFDFGDYGPLDVTVNWASNTGSTTFGDCAAPPEDVLIMGYLLQYSTGEVADEVDIDTDPMSCTTDLSWLETEFDLYTLVLDGEDYYDTYRWGSTCTDLVVDDETENAWSCDVIMTMYP